MWQRFKADAGKLWRGEEPVKRAFWLWGLLGNFAIAGVLVLYYCVFFFATYAFRTPGSELYLKFFWGVPSLLALLYLTWSTVAGMRTCWRSRQNSSTWTYLLAALPLIAFGYWGYGFLLYIGIK